MAGTLSLVSFTLSTTTVALDTINSGAAPDDWAQFDASFTPTNRKNGGGSTISATITGGGGPNTVGDGRTVSWTGGTPTASGSSSTAVYNSLFSANAGVIYTVPADTSVRTVWLMVGPYNTSTCKIVAALSDGSATTITDTTTMHGPSTTTNPAVLIFSYSANSASQSLTITITNQATSPQTHLLEAIAVAVSGAAAAVVSVARTPLSPLTGSKVFGPLGMSGFAVKRNIQLSTLAASGVSALVFGQTGALTGAGALVGSSALTFGQTGTLIQPGLQGTSALIFGQTGTLTAAGSLAGSSALVFSETGALTGAGVLAGTSALSFAQTAALTAAGILAGSSALSFAQTAALAASGVLTGSSVLSFGASATADQPAGALVGTASLTFGQSGDLSGFGTLIGNCQILFDASGFVPNQSNQPGAVDTPRMSPGHYRRKKKPAKNEPVFDESTVFIPPASLEQAPKPETATIIARKIERVSLAQASRIDLEIKELLRQEAENDDQEALRWILKALDS